MADDNTDLQPQVAEAKPQSQSVETTQVQPEIPPTGEHAAPQIINS